MFGLGYWSFNLMPRLQVGGSSPTPELGGLKHSLPAGELMGSWWGGTSPAVPWCWLPNLEGRDAPLTPTHWA